MCICIYQKSSFFCEVNRYDDTKMFICLYCSLRVIKSQFLYQRKSLCDRWNIN